MNPLADVVDTYYLDAVCNGELPSIKFFDQLERPWYPHYTQEAAQRGFVPILKWAHHFKHIDMSHVPTYTISPHVLLWYWHEVRFSPYQIECILRRHPHLTQQCHQHILFALDELRRVIWNYLIPDVTHLCLSFL